MEIRNLIRRKSGTEIGAILLVMLMLLVPVSVFAQEEGKEDKPKPASGETEDGSENESGGSQEDDEPTLTIGTKAPELDIEHWISDDSGFYLHTEEFEEDNVYVIDFWAFEWQPTLRTLPTLSSLQEKFKDDDVQIISIGLNDLGSVESFLDRKNPAVKADPKTLREVTESYSFTCDPDRSVFEDYMDASGRTQVPTSFVVGKTGLIEWIGHPNELEGPLKKIIDDKWDRDAFAKVYKVEMEKQALANRQNEVLGRLVTRIPRGKGPEAVLGFIEEESRKSENKIIERQLTMMLVQMKIELDKDDAAETLKRLADDFTTDEDSALELNNMIWTYYERYEQGRSIDDAVLDACLYAAKVAIKFAPKSGAINDTVAHFVYVVEEDLDAAIEWQKKAVANAEGREADLQPFLDKLLKEKETGKKAVPKKEKQRKKTDF